MNQTYNLSATNGGNNYTLQLSYVPGAQATFNGQPAFTATETFNLSENGTLLTNVISINYFTISPYTNVGGVNQSSGQVAVYANQKALPQLATVGQSGALDTFTIYTDNTGTTVYATGTQTWSLEADTSTTALGCLDETVNLSAGGTDTESDCYQMDERGNVLSLQITLLVNGVTLNFQ